MNGREASRKAVAAGLRARLAVFDQTVVPPPDLQERVTASAAHRHGMLAASQRGRWSTLVLARTAITGIVFALMISIGWCLLHPMQKADEDPGVELTAYTTEWACQQPRTLESRALECGLDVRRDVRRDPRSL